MLSALEYDEIQFCKVMRYSVRIDGMEKRKEHEESKLYIKDVSVWFIILVIYFNLLMCGY